MDLLLATQPKVKVLSFPGTSGCAPCGGFCSGQNQPQAVASFGKGLSTSHSFTASLLWLTAESHKERLLGDVVLD